MHFSPISPQFSSLKSIYMLFSDLFSNTFSVLFFSFQNMRDQVPYPYYGEPMFYKTVFRFYFIKLYFDSKGLYIYWTDLHEK